MVKIIRGKVDLLSNEEEIENIADIDRYWSLFFGDDISIFLWSVSHVGNVANGNVLDMDNFGVRPAII